MLDISQFFGVCSGSPVQSCDCGRVHYDSTGGFMDEGELEDLEKKHQKEPSKYIPNDGHSVSWIDVTLLGHRVYDCPCGWHKVLYRFLDLYKDGIVRFYEERAEHHQQEADENKSAFEAIEGRK